MKKICIVTGTRAEYGLLRPLIDKINKDEDIELQLVVTGMHLSKEFGYTYKQIEEDGYKIKEKINILSNSDDSVSISEAMSKAILEFSKCFIRLKPDIIVLLGDRYEIFSVASAATVLRIPITHINGGETTEGAFDEAYRHSITKMSYLHFTSTEEYRKRVIQLGECPERVFNVGALGVENIKNIKLLSKAELEKSINFSFDKNVALITFHPVTLENNTAVEQFNELLSAIDEVNDLKIIFTKANSDTDGMKINKLIDNYVEHNQDKAIAFTSMGILKYLSAMKYCSFVLGNSSSGIAETPSFKIPTINIGDRQKGRIQALSVINCEPKKENILNSINIALSFEFKSKLYDIKNPYEGTNTSEKIIKTIKDFLLNNKINLKKKFYDI